MPATAHAKGPNRLKLLREAKGLSQEEVAKAVGYAQATVARHELSVRGMTGEAIDRYARLFGVPTYQLFTEPYGKVKQ